MYYAMCMCSHTCAEVAYAHEHVRERARFARQMAAKLTVAQEEEVGREITESSPSLVHNDTS